MARPRNTPQRSKRALKAGECLKLHLQGKPQAAIAAELGISQPTVSRYIDVALRERRGGDSEVAALREREVAKCDMHEALAYAKFEESGDRVFLAEALDAAKERRKLQAVYPATVRRPAGAEVGARLAALLGLDTEQLPE